jgi:starvation-inducible DNA-binding protein
MYTTSLDLSANIRTASTGVLNARLADAIDLAAQLNHAHWNIHGPHFIVLHQLFDALNAEVAEQADQMAERIAAFGETAHGTLQQVMRATTLAAYPVDAKSERTHLETLAASLSTYCANVRAAARTAQDGGDGGTADLFTQISRAADQQLWKIEAHFRPAR